MRSRGFSTQAEPTRYVLARGERPVTMTRRSRRRTPLWLALYTTVLAAVAALSVASGKWSIALTTLLLAVAFGWLTLRFWRRR